MNLSNKKYFQSLSNKNLPKVKTTGLSIEEENDDDADIFDENKKLASSIPILSAFQSIKSFSAGYKESFFFSNSTKNINTTNANTNINNSSSFKYNVNNNVVSSNNDLEDDLIAMDLIVRLLKPEPSK